MIEFDENKNLAAKVKIIGIGGGGNNALNTMISYQLSGWILSQPIRMLKPWRQIWLPTNYSWVKI